MIQQSAQPPSEERPKWAELLQPSSLATWNWSGRRLVHRAVSGMETRTSSVHPLQRFFVRMVYATQNSSRRVQRALVPLLQGLKQNEWGVNIGAGDTRLHPQVINIDIYLTPSIDIVTKNQDLPFADDTLSLVVSQEVLEHLPYPEQTVSEALRVLRPGGLFYCQVPFIIGYHPGPEDYWRFTKEGLRRLFSGGGWEIRELDIALGHGSGFYRIAVEYVAVTVSAISERLYLPTKALAALLLLPLKLPDLLSSRLPQRHRIPGGYYCIAEKRRPS